MIMKTKLEVSSANDRWMNLREHFLVTKLSSMKWNKTFVYNSPLELQKQTKKVIKLLHIS